MGSHLVRLVLTAVLLCGFYGAVRGIDNTIHKPVSQNITADDAEGSSYPTTSEVVDDLNMPYNGPCSVEVTEDRFLILNVGGNIGNLVIPLGASSTAQICSVIGMATMSYEETNGQLLISLADSNNQESQFVFQIGFAASGTANDMETFAAGGSNDCPANKKCCSCTSNNGGSANATCNDDERPICNCNPCCNATCAKMKQQIEAN